MREEMWSCRGREREREKGREVWREGCGERLGIACSAEAYSDTTERFGLVLRLPFAVFEKSYAGSRKQAKPAPHGAAPLFLAGTNVYGQKFLMLRPIEVQEFHPVDRTSSNFPLWILQLAQFGRGPCA